MYMSIWLLLSSCRASLTPQGTPPPTQQPIWPTHSTHSTQPAPRPHRISVTKKDEKKLQWRTRISCILQRSNAQMLLSRAVNQESSCPAHAYRARASCLPDSNPYGRDGLAHSRSLPTARRALRVA